jgi:predicted SAM-dependent methyltransferase
VEAGSNVKPEPKFQTLEHLPHEPPFGHSVLGELGVRGLQCGSAGILRLGPWLNTDLMAIRVADGETPEFERLTRIDGRLFLRHDAMQPFPFEDESFDWVYSEHFIEHFFPSEAVTWLTEMRRLLKPGGHVRISTPDLRKYVRGYLEPDNGFFAEHYWILDHALGRFVQGDLENAPAWGQEFNQRYVVDETEVPRRPGFMVNQIFHLWGHRWIYDPDELRHVAAAAGFPSELAVECAHREGREPEVARLDLPIRSDESLYFELERV